jgi:hypothetical protein
MGQSTDVKNFKTDLKFGSGCEDMITRRMGVFVCSATTAISGVNETRASARTLLTNLLLGDTSLSRMETGEI